VWWPLPRCGWRRRGGNQRAHHHGVCACEGEGWKEGVRPRVYVSSCTQSAPPCAYHPPPLHCYTTPMCPVLAPRVPPPPPTPPPLLPPCLPRLPPGQPAALHQPQPAAPQPGVPRAGGGWGAARGAVGGAGHSSRGGAVLRLRVSVWRHPTGRAKQARQGTAAGGTSATGCSTAPPPPFPPTSQRSSLTPPLPSPAGPPHTCLCFLLLLQV
jgi:hypothetical protein